MFRRSFLVGTGATLLSSSLVSSDNLLREGNLGDADAPSEDINLSIDQITRIEDLTRGLPDIVRDQTLYPVIDRENLFRHQFMKVVSAEADANVNRSNNRSRITEYLNLFGLGFSDPITNKPYAYCASGLSWAACVAYCDLALGLSPTLYRGLDYNKLDRITVFQTVLKEIRRNYFRPHPQVEVIAQDARKREIWEDGTSIPKVGWLVFYNWSGGNHADHIGIVHQASGSSLKTIEFNTSINTGSQTNGGFVAYKDRTSVRNRVIGYARMY